MRCKGYRSVVLPLSDGLVDKGVDTILYVDVVEARVVLDGWVTGEDVEVESTGWSL